MPDIDARLWLRSTNAPVPEPGVSALEWLRGQAAPPALPPRNLQAGPGVPLTGRAAFIAENQEPGVMLDIDTGAPAGVRAGLGLHRTLEDQVSYLQGIYGPESVRLTKDRELIARIPDADGKLRDVLVDEDKMTGKDLLDVTGAIPEMIGALLAVRGGRGLGKLGGATGKTGIARDVLFGAAGAQAAGGATDLGLRILSGEDPDLPEIFESRMQMAKVDTVISGGLIGAGALIRGVFNRIMAPLAPNIGPVQMQAAAAVAAIERKTGVKIPLSVAEATGSPMMARAETFLQNVPGARGRFIAAKAAQEQKLAEVQNFMLGNAPLPPEAEVGRQAVAQLRKLTTAADEAADQATRTAIRDQQERILRSFDQMTVPERQLFSADVGDAVRARAMALRQEFFDINEVNYGLVAQAPGGTDSIISTARLRSTIAEIKQQFGRAPLPAGTARFLDEFAQVPERMTLNEVRQMRRTIQDQIDRSAALPGPDAHVLGRMSSAITEGIDHSVGALPDGQLKAALSRANKYYAENHGRFRQQGIAELFRDANTPGHVGSAKIVSRIVSGKGDPDLYAQMRKFLGAASSEWKMLQRSMLDDVYERSVVGGTPDLIDGKAFVSALRNLDRNIARDILGPRGPELFASGNAIAALSSGKLTRAELQAALGPGASIPASISQAIRHNVERDRIYRNQIVKKFAAGELGSEAIRPEEFVGRYLEHSNVPELREVMTRLNSADPHLVESIRRKTIQRIFQDAARRPTAEDLVRGVGNDPTKMVTGESLHNAMGHENRRAIYREVLGSETYDLLNDYVRVEAARGTKDRLGGVAGGLVGGGVLARMLNLQFGELMRVSKYRIAGIIMSNPVMRKWLTNTYQFPEIDGLAKAIVISEPFARGLTEEFAEDTTAYRVLGQIRRAVGLEPPPPPPQIGPQQQPPGAPQMGP